MFKKLKNKWGIESNYQFWLIFSIFGISGTSMLFIKPHLFDFIGINSSTHPILYVLLYILTITPAYFVVLFALGSLAGQFRFFWEFKKRMIKKICTAFR